MGGTKMRKAFVTAFVLSLFGAWTFAAPSPEDLALAEKYKAARFSTKGLKPSSTYPSQNVYRLADGMTLWDFLNGYVIARTIDKVEITMFLRGGKELSRTLSFPSGRSCEVLPDGRLVWSLLFERAPDFTLKRLGGSGSSVRLSESRGKVVLLDFWGSWCGPCIGALPETQALYEKDRTKGLEVYGINIEGDEAKAASTAKALGLGFPTLMAQPDSSGRYNWNAKQVADYRVSAIPIVFLIDGEGTIVAINPDEKEIARRLVLR